MAFVTMSVIKTTIACVQKTAKLPGNFRVKIYVIPPRLQAPYYMFMSLLKVSVFIRILHKKIIIIIIIKTLFRIQDTKLQNINLRTNK